jgi:hypothetical protein
VVDNEILIYTSLSYGYGKPVAWEKLAEQQAALDAWAKGICERFACTASMQVMANFS